MSNKRLLDELSNIQNSSNAQAGMDIKKSVSIEDILNSIKNMEELETADTENEKLLSRRVDEVFGLLDKIGIRIERLGEETPEETALLNKIRKQVQSKELDLANIGFFSKLFGSDSDIKKDLVKLKTKLETKSKLIKDAVERRLKDPDLKRDLDDTTKQVNEVIARIDTEFKMIKAGHEKVMTALSDSKKAEISLDKEVISLDKEVVSLTTEESDIRKALKFATGSEHTKLGQDLSKVVDKLKTVKNKTTTALSLLEQTRSDISGFRIAIDTTGEVLQLQETELESLKQRSKNYETMFKHRIEIKSAMATLNASTEMGTKLRQTEIDNATQIAATGKVASQTSLNVLQANMDAADKTASIYKEAKRQVNNINEKTAELSKRTRRNVNLDT